MPRLVFRISAVLSLLASSGVNADGRVPAGYQPAYSQVIAAARREGALHIWSTTDNQNVAELLAEFRRRYPGIAIDYDEISALGINQRLLDDIRAKRPSADVLWSSAMDLQIKLVNDGYAQTYSSPEKNWLPEWANWKDQAWGTTAEPIVMIYNRRLISDTAMPKNHQALREWLEKRAGRRDATIATYDPALSATGYLYLAQDKQALRSFWQLAAAMGKNRVHLFPTAGGVLNDVAAGRSAIGYNVLGSYALDEASRNPDLGVVLPYDYTLVMSRIAMIPARAPHPNAARLFVDFLISRGGQARLAIHRMTSVRTDVPRPKAMTERPGAMRAIRVGPTLLVTQDRLTRENFMTKWNRALSGR